MGFLDFIFGNKKSHIETYLKNGAVILDVRTLQEWNDGHIENSIHIPLDELPNRIKYIIQLGKPVIVCCESGVRSARATKFLNLNNIDAVNGGGWKSLKNRL
ncbi:rhodanese-like domain-containing protein [Winogradskyella flava]|uniref:Rhodanese-like domain-containing protein n=1 Tax=Winogradskyella flava TaxID=1884876 RepID=A0A842IXP4_9FLAO|nr:rhodanese-like domain-containing protein [Winogradskyella flava]MBC2846443.1 rhodanese-like domain-containing protein [Winogradskyella flava]